MNLDVHENDEFISYETRASSVYAKRPNHSQDRCGPRSDLPAALPPGPPK